MAPSTDYGALSTEELERRLRRADLTAAEEDALADELSRRLTDDLLAGRDVPPDPERGPVPRDEPERGTSEREQARRERPAAGEPPPRRRRRRERPTEAAGAHQAGTDRAAPTAAGEPRRAGGRFLVGLVAALVLAAAAWAALPALLGANEEDPVPDLPSADPVDIFTEVPASEVPAAPVDVVPGEFVAPTGRVAVGWVTPQGLAHAAVIETNGDVGVADVTYPNPVDGTPITVRQDLYLEQLGAEWWYSGADPRDPATGQPVPGYAADSFRLQQAADGPYLDRTCDEQGLCADLRYINPEG